MISKINFKNELICNLVLEQQYQISFSIQDKNQKNNSLYSFQLLFSIKEREKYHIFVEYKFATNRCPKKYFGHFAHLVSNFFKDLSAKSEDLRILSFPLHSVEFKK